MKNSSKRNTLKILLICLLVLVFIKPNLQVYAINNDFSSGSGTENDPYIITNADQLNAIRYHLDAHFKLANDIDLNLEDGSNGWEPIGTFTGILDGNGYQIQGLWIHRNDILYVGLFSTIENATIKNLGIIMDDKGVIGPSIVGGLVAYTINSTIINCYTTGNVQGNGYTGGLVGCLDGGSIDKSFSTVSANGLIGVGNLVGYQSNATISNSFSTGSTSGFMAVGNLVGLQSNGTISNTYSSGSVSGSDAIGGLIGYQQVGTISNSYTSTMVSGSDGIGGLDIGGLIGYQHNGTITNSYFNRELSQIQGVGNDVTAIGAVGLTTAQMIEDDTLRNAMSNLDTSIWSKREAENYYYYPELAVFYGDGTLDSAKQRASEMGTRAIEKIIIEQPEAILSGDYLTVETPNVSIQTKQEGWQLSADGKTGWQEYSGNVLSARYNDYYLRYYVVLDSELYLYSNVVQITVNKWKPSLEKEVVLLSPQDSEEKGITVSTTLKDGIDLTTQEIEFIVTKDNETMIYHVNTDENNVATFTIPHLGHERYTFSAIFKGNSENYEAFSDEIEIIVDNTISIKDIEDETKKVNDDVEKGLDIGNLVMEKNRTDSIATGDITNISLWFITFIICMGTLYKWRKIVDK